MRVIYPFTAIVGQERMKRALILNAVEPRIGGVLIRGERGTAKSTAARALAALLPQVKVVDDCRFACDPDHPETWCTECRERVKRGEELPVAFRRTPFVDLPVSATEDRVVGTLDIESAIQKGERRFDAGILAAANRGLLYIDEVNLLDDHVVDVLLDSAAMGMNIVEREGISFTHPARFILVAAANPCPCGFLGDPKHSCRCLPGEIARYRKRLSGPLLDRIDLHLAVPAVEIKKLTGEAPPDQETSKEAREKIEKARLRQRKRFLKTPLICNAEMSTREVKQFCFIEEEARQILGQAAERLHLSARSYFRTLKVAQTIADLAGEEKIKKDYIFEALQYRSSASD